MLQRAKLKSCDGWLLQDAWTSTAEFSTTDGAIFWMDPAAGPRASVSATIVLDLPSGPLDLLSRPSFFRPFTRQSDEVLSEGAAGAGGAGDGAADAADGDVHPGRDGGGQPAGEERGQRCRLRWLPRHVGLVTAPSDDVLNRVAGIVAWCT